MKRSTRTQCVNYLEDDNTDLRSRAIRNFQCKDKLISTWAEGRESMGIMNQRGEFHFHIQERSEDEWDFKHEENDIIWLTIGLISNYIPS